MVDELRACQERTFVWDSTLNRYREARDYAPEEVLMKMGGSWADFDKYKKDYRKLSDYEFFKLYRSEENDAQREKYLRQALEVSPSFMIAANDLAALLIKHNRPDADVLRKFAGEKAPEVVNRNQMVALLANHEYQAADSLAAYVPATAENRLLLAVSGAFMGDYEANYDAIAPTVCRSGKCNRYHSYQA